MPEQVKEKLILADSFEITVTRGPVSWNYIYVALGFAIAIEGTIIQMITPLIFPWNVIVFAVCSALTFYLFLANGRFQNQILSLKGRYENKPR